jgi:hypothetical protein
VPSLSSTLKKTAALANSASTPKKLPPTARTPGVNVNVSASGNSVENTPSCT